ncbi:MAG: hypothetical protein M3N21_09505 [Actinomycetota bacterium]|nr:hypothetical protein [Actinomycetota bacterium]
MRREVPPTTTVVPEPTAYVATPVDPVVTTVRRRRVVSDVETGVARDSSPWLWLLGLLVVLLVGLALYFANRNDTAQPASTTPSPATTVVVQQQNPAPPPPAAPVIVQQPAPVIVQQPPAQQQPQQQAPQQQASQPAPAAS